MTADLELLDRLRAGDERAFQELVTHYHPIMLRVARQYVKTRGVAEEVVQETWLAALKGLDKFEGRSSFKTWLFRILSNRAKTRATREGRVVPLSTLAREDDDGPVDPERFAADGHWASPPDPWSLTPEKATVDVEVRKQIEAAIAALPERQRMVIQMRDVEGFTSEEVCNAMDISETNQRVLLHRARTKVRDALDDYLRGAR